MNGRWTIHAWARTSAIVVIAAAAAAPSFAEVIHDQRGMMASGAADGHVDALISGAGTAWGEIRDQQACDDFVLAAPMRITRITADFVNAPPSSQPALQPILPPAGGFLIEFFPDVDGAPSETPSAALTSLEFENLGAFTPPATNPTVDSEETATFRITLPGAGAALDAGIWWISIVPVDETPFGQRYKWMGQQQPKALTGSLAHDRAGGVDHGNGYPGQQTNTDWRSRPGSFLHFPRELSFTLEGLEIFSADIDGDGVVGSADLAAMLGQWGACAGGGACPADLDGDGAVGSADLASLLGAWGSAG